MGPPYITMCTLTRVLTIYPQLCKVDGSTDSEAYVRDARSGSGPMRVL